MGMPVMGIYAYELYTAYDVKNLIRVSSAAHLTEMLKLKIWSLL